MLKGIVRPDSCFSRPIEFLRVITCKLPTNWSRIMDRRKDERVSYHNGIRDIWSFSQSEAQKLGSVQPLFCPKLEFSSEVGFRMSVTSKPFSGQSCMSNGYKAWRVAHGFGVQLRDRICLEQFCFRLFLTAVHFCTDFSLYFSQVNLWG
jgi:hypothetical protein